MEGKWLPAWYYNPGAFLSHCRWCSSTTLSGLLISRRCTLLQVSSYAGPAKESVGSNALYAAFVASGAASKCVSSFQVGRNLNLP